MNNAEKRASAIGTEIGTCIVDGEARHLFVASNIHGSVLLSFSKNKDGSECTNTVLLGKYTGKSLLRQLFKEYLI